MPSEADSTHQSVPAEGAEHARGFGGGDPLPGDGRVASELVFVAGAERGRRRPQGLEPKLPVLVSVARGQEADRNGFVRVLGHHHSLTPWRWQRLLRVRCLPSQRKRVMGMDVLEIFKDSPKARTYPAGEVIFRAGDVAHEMYVVIEGTIDIILDGRNIEELNPGNVFGEMAIVDEAPRSADAVARTDVRVEPIDQEWFKHLIRRSPTFGLHVMGVMAQRLRKHMRPLN